MLFLLVCYNKHVFGETSQEVACDVFSMQSPKEIENWYKDQDPWGYKDNEFDKERKAIILDDLSLYGHFHRALDIGCGEGWITKDLPAKEIHGIELSDTASGRFPKNVKRVKEPEGEYDLVIATGVMYKHYDWKKFVEWINESATGIVLISSISEWEVSEIHDMVRGKFSRQRLFPYREYKQRLTIYRCDDIPST